MLDNYITRGPDEPGEEFVCERCGEECDDTSYQPLCPDCWHETEDDAP